MINYKLGDIILVEYQFTNGAGSKKRPALIISNNDYNISREEVIALAVTTNVKRILYGDTKLEQWHAAGLLHPSLVTAIMRTIKKSLIVKKIGFLTPEDIKTVQCNVCKVLNFPNE